MPLVKSGCEHSVPVAASSLSAQLYATPLKAIEELDDLVAQTAPGAERIVATTSPLRARLASMDRDLKLVIFDCDGVLVDSEHLAVRVDVRVLAELGWKMTEDDVIERFLGRSNEHFIVEVEAYLGRQLSWTTGKTSTSTSTARHSRPSCVRWKASSRLST